MTQPTPHSQVFRIAIMPSNSMTLRANRIVIGWIAISFAFFAVLGTEVSGQELNTVYDNTFRDPLPLGNGH